MDFILWIIPWSGTPVFYVFFWTIFSFLLFFLNLYKNRGSLTDTDEKENKNNKEICKNFPWWKLKKPSLSEKRDRILKNKAWFLLKRLVLLKFLISLYPPVIIPSLQYLYIIWRKKVGMKLIFLQADKHWVVLHVKTINFGGHGHSSPKYRK